MAKARKSRRRSSSSSTDEAQSEAPSTRRISSRSNKFSASMKDPTESILDLLGNTPARLGPSPAKSNARSRQSKNSSSDSEDSEDSDNSEESEESEDQVDPPSRKRRSNRVSTASRSPKSPAVRHSRVHRRVKKDIHVSSSEDSESSSSNEDDDDDDSDDDSSSSEDDDDDDEDELKIQRIIACKSETIAAWKNVCKKLNTSEVENGSRWFQESDEKSSARDDNKFEERFLVKWADMSYLHCSWETQEDLKDQVDTAKTHLTNFFRKSVNGYLFSADERLDGEYYDPGYVQVDRILEVTPPENAGPKDPDWGIIYDKNHEDYESGTGRQFLIKWCNAPYAEISYEFERDLIMMDVEYTEQVDALKKRSKKPTKNAVKKSSVTHEGERRRLYKIFGERVKDSEEKESTIEKYRKGLEENIFINGGQLRDYQAEGVSWLLANHINKRSSILADEMGLGKTIQTAVYVNSLATKLQSRGPYLIIAPLSTIPHWYREFTGWTELNTIIYHGSAQDREHIREYEFPFECDRPQNVGFNQRYLKNCHKVTAPKWEKTWMVQVVITTPEMMVTDDFSELASVSWDLLVVDEAHRLKNHSSKLANNLRHRDFGFKHTLLLTGTPIQNNMNELWTLMNIIDPIKFKDAETFLDLYGNMRSKDHVDDLHDAIRPYILRRLKEDVEKSVPPKEETLIEVELTVLQKQYYRALYEKNVQFLHRNVKKALDGPSISNLAMQLRKCCNHPFLLNGVEADVRKNAGENLSSKSEADFLAKASGKLILLDKLLPKLKEGGHRVLLFSQFKIMLDILEDYLDLREFKHERIDGSITGKKRQMAIDRYQAKESMESSFIMLLSTRAGGVGINLTAADTCIIFDSDWNPQNDIQAQARCHRIGQTKSVKVYRLLSRKTYEMQMFHMSSLKMGLDQAVLQGIENGGSSGSEGQKNAMTKEEVEKLLRHGAYDIFSEEKAGTSEKESTDFEEQDIDSILARRAKTFVHDNTGSKSNAAGGTFSKASFKASSNKAHTEDSGNNDVDVDDPDFWKKMVGESKFEEVDDNLSGKKRARTKANYNEQQFDKNLDYELMSPDQGKVDEGDFYSPSDSSGESDNESTIVEKGKIEFLLPNGPIPENDQLQQIMDQRKEAKSDHEKRHWGGKSATSWRKVDADLILNMLFQYGYGNISWKTFIASFLSKSAKKYGEAEIKRLCWAFCLVALREAVDEDVAEMARRAKRIARKKEEVIEGKKDLNSEEEIDSADPKKLKNRKKKSGNEPNSQDKLNCALEDGEKKQGKELYPDETTKPKDRVEEDKNENNFQEKLGSAEFTKSKVWKVNQLNRSFTKIWSSYSTVALKALSDGTEFAKSNPPRDPVRLGTDKQVKEEKSCNLLVDGFVKNVWPALTSRGWKEALSKEGRKKKRRRQFSYEGTCYLSLVEVLDAAPRVHPELKNIVEGVISVAASELKPKEVKVQSTIPSINPSQISCHSLDLFLAHYAPLQLMADRRKSRRMPISLRTSQMLSFLQNAHSLVAKARDTQSAKIPSADEYFKLANLISVNPRASLPHPLWKPVHDAVLILAITKHGWIDRDIRCLAITNDKDIVWGHPFEEVKKNESDTISVPLKNKPVKKEVDIDELGNISHRVIIFLNDFEGSLEELKGFNLSLILSTHGIKRIINENGVGERWVFDACLLNSEPHKECNADNGNSTKQSPDSHVLSELPRRKALLKRAKAILAKPSIVTPFASNATLSPNKLPQKSDQYTVLDQSNLCNIFLAEVLRTIIRSGKNKTVIKKLVAFAKKEAEFRFQASARKKNGKSNPNEALEMKNIVEHIGIVVRESILSPSVKNVLRAIMGLELVKPKKPGDPLLPPNKRQAMPITKVASLPSKEDKQSEKELQGSKADQKVNQKESASGDVAINRALGLARRKENAKANRNCNNSSNNLPITYIEALLLSVFCSQGVPILRDDWQALFTTEGMGENEYIITWLGLGAILEAAAKQWCETAKKNLLCAQEIGKKAVDISELQIEVDAKKEALIDAMRLHQSPDRLAKKSIMLLEAVRIRIGHTEFQKRKTQKKNEHELGLRPLQWNSKHLSHWANTLHIIQNGRPLANTGADFMTNQHKITPGGYLDKKGCRAIFIQVSQQTRLRSLFVKYGSRELNAMLFKATKNCLSSGETLETLSTKCTNNHELSSKHDKILLSGMLRYGFGGFDEMVRQSESSLLFSDTDVGVKCITRKSVQQRLNHLTRELSALDDTADNIRLLNERKKNRFNAGMEALNDERVPKSNTPRIQIGINAFFRSPNKSRKEVITLSDDSTSDESPKRKAVESTSLLPPEKKLKK